MKLDPRPWRRQRWLIIHNALVDPREATDIAKHTGTTVAMVHQVIASYNRLGVAAIETPGKGGRRHQYMTWEEEQEFLAPFSHEVRNELHIRLKWLHGLIQSSRLLLERDQKIPLSLRNTRGMKDALMLLH